MRIEPDQPIREETVDDVQPALYATAMCTTSARQRCSGTHLAAVAANSAIAPPIKSRLTVSTTLRRCFGKVTSWDEIDISMI